MALFGSGSDASEAAAIYASHLNRGRKRARNDLGSGMDALREAYGSAQGYYEPYAGGAQAGFNAYGDAVGLGGQEGYDRTLENFRTSPGYEFALNQGMQATERAAAAGGRLDSGNTRIALQDRAMGMADQEWNSYLDRLSPYLTIGPSIAGAQAGISTGLGDREYGYGSDLAGLEWSTAQGIGNAFAQAKMQEAQQSQANFGNILGGLSLGAKLLGFL